MDLRTVAHPPHIMLQKPLKSSSPGRDEHDKSDRISETGDPIYYTIGSDKDSKPKPLTRNCVSLENLGWITIKNDLTTPEQHHKNALTMQQHPHSRNYNPGGGVLMDKYQTPPLFVPRWHPSMMHPHDYWRLTQQFAHQGPMPVIYPNGNPQNDKWSNANSKQSLASDDYLKYRDVAL